MTFLPSFFRKCAILPIEVVFPTPFTPITRITDGWVLRWSGSPSPTIPRRISASADFTSSASLIRSDFTRSRNSSMIRSVVAAPISPQIMISSSSSSSSSSTFRNDFTTSLTCPNTAFFVLMSPCFSLSKNPIYPFPSIYLLCITRFSPLPIHPVFCGRPLPV